MASFAEKKEFAEQLRSQGLRIVEMKYDGNCLFRAVAFQKHGDANKHRKIRDRTVDTIEENDEEYAPFIESEEQFEKYCAKMRKEGEWGGNIELSAISRMLGMKVCVHQVRKPILEVNDWKNEGRKAIKSLHLSYHEGQHYNAIRMEGDMAKKPAMEVVITDVLFKQPSRKDMTAEEQTVVRATGCDDIDKVKDLIYELDGDVRAVVKLLKNEMKKNKNKLIEDKKEDAIDDLKNSVKAFKKKKKRFGVF